MNKLIFIISIVLIFAFTSCSEDKCDHNLIEESGNNEIPPVIGSWYDSSANEEITFFESGTYYDRYCNYKKSWETEGRWEYNSSTRKLTQTFSFNGQNIFNDWTVKNMSETSFKIESDKNGTVELQRVVASYNLEVGQSVNFIFPEDIYNCPDAKFDKKYKVQSLKSLNSRLASVDQDGKITAVGEKGTTYIQINTDFGTVWARVTVGDDRLDLWYDWSLFLGASFDDLSKALGKYSNTGEDGYTYSWDVYSESDHVSQIVMFLNYSNTRVDEIVLNLKKVPVSEIRSYLESHYYSFSGWGEDMYITSSDIYKSNAVVSYNENENSIRFISASSYRLNDYSCYLGKTKEEIKSEWGQPLDSTSSILRYATNNVYIDYVDFIIDSKTDIVYSIISKMNNKDLALFLQTVINNNFEGINIYAPDSDYSKYKYAFINNAEFEDASVEIIVDGYYAKGTITYYDLNYFGLDYDYMSFLGQYLKTFKDTFAKSVALGENWYKWDLYSKLFLDLYDVEDYNYVCEEIFLTARNGSESTIMNYLESNYTHSELLTKDYYLTNPDVEKSKAVMWFDELYKHLHFESSSHFLWNDYVYTFGRSKGEIQNEFSEAHGYKLLPHLGENFYGGLKNFYNDIVEFSYYNNKVINLQIYFNENLSEQITKILNSKYIFIREEDNSQLIYRDNEDPQLVKVQVQYYPSHNTAVFFNCDYYVRGESRSRANQEIIFER